jgi:hypothetical protein
MNPFFLYKMRWIKLKTISRYCLFKDTVLAEGVRFYVRIYVWGTCSSQCKLCTVNDLV